MRWQQRSVAILAALYRLALTEAMSVDEFKRRVFAAYPFGVREHTPYRIWRRVAGDYERRYAYDVKYGRVEKE